MAESDVHRQLVRLLASRIRGGAPSSWASFIDGVRLDERDGVPPKIGSHRPDIYAIMRETGKIVIGEAKTADDIDNDHTKSQLAAYFTHISHAGGEVWIAVPFLSAGTAHRVCRVKRKELKLEDIPFVITGWLFGPKIIGETWYG